MPATASERGKITHTFKGHQGYVCNARWIDGTKLLTTSGDNTAALWDLGKTRARRAATPRAAPSRRAGTGPRPLRETIYQDI